MYRHILFIATIYSFFTTSFSLRCYTGTDRDCVLTPNTTTCGPDGTCQCVKYRFQCTTNDKGCNENEQSSGVTKWGYGIVGKSKCETMQKSSSGYSEVTCCSEYKCNRPSAGRCSEFQARRRATRYITDQVDF